MANENDEKQIMLKWTILTNAYHVQYNTIPFILHYIYIYLMAEHRRLRCVIWAKMKNEWWYAVFGIIYRKLVDICLPMRSNAAWTQLNIAKLIK